jgi:hypothetical protein
MIKEKDGIAAVDAAQLLDPEQRKMADTPRVAEPAIKLQKVVSASIHQSTSSLDADPWSVLGRPATMRANFIHSYSDCRISLAIQKSLLRGLLLTCVQDDELSAGSDWFNLPKTVVTPQLKRDFQMLELRSVLDPHR